jgi:hypothetical protein
VNGLATVENYNNLAPPNYCPLPTAYLQSFNKRSASLASPMALILFYVNMATSYFIDNEAFLYLPPKPLTIEKFMA